MRSPDMGQQNIPLEKQQPDTPASRRRPSQKRCYVLDGQSVVTLGYDVPWEENADDEKVRVSGDALMGRLYDPPRFDYVQWDWKPQHRDDKLCARRRSLWGAIQLALSGVPVEKILERTGTTAVAQFTLAPANRSLVPLQWVHIGPGAIPDALADIPCTNMSVPDMLHNLNDILGTPHPLTYHIRALLEQVRGTSRDFGEAYGKVRNWWTDPHLEMVGQKEYSILYEHEARHDGWRRDAIQSSILQRADIPPRRVWDLYSNRVLPFAVIPQAIEGLEPHQLPDLLWTVSHSWVAEPERHSVWTMINGEQWPVPIPRATSLEHIRVELLNMGAQYVWLDVLCLRQEGREEDEAQRVEEWKIDVPTIGHVYRGTPSDRPCVTYFNGLGLPLNLSPNMLNSDRHWFNRVWTLQESLTSWLPGGLSGAPLAGSQAFFARLAALPELTNADSSNAIVRELMRRSCTTELDRIAGLAYCLRCRTLPLYRASMPPEEAWQRLLRHDVSEKWRASLLLRYAADTPFALHPSWDAYVATGPVLPRMTVISGLRPLAAAAQDPLHAGRAGRCYHISYISEPCYIVQSETATESDGSLHLPELKLCFGRRGARGTFAFTPLDAHGVVLQDVPYALVRVFGAEGLAVYWVVVEVLTKQLSWTTGLQVPVVKTAKWAAMQVTEDDDDRLQQCARRNWRKVVYVSGEEALRRTRYRDDFTEAFIEMRKSGRNFVVAQHPDV